MTELEGQNISAKAHCLHLFIFHRGFHIKGFRYKDIIIYHNNPLHLLKLCFFKSQMNADSHFQSQRIALLVCFASLLHGMLFLM